MEPDGGRPAAVGRAEGRLDAAVVAGRHRPRKLVHRSPDLLVLLGHLGHAARPKFRPSEVAQVRASQEPVKQVPEPVRVKSRLFI